jgi:hypothetical protein
MEDPVDAQADPQFNSEGHLARHGRASPRSLAHQSPGTPTQGCLAFKWDRTDLHGSITRRLGVTMLIHDAMLMLIYANAEWLVYN